MDAKDGHEGEGALPEAFTVAEAIYGGLCNVADAIRELAKSMSGEEYGEPQEPLTYLDGSPIK